MRHTAQAMIMVLATAGAAVAQDDYRHGRIRDVEATVSLQREAEPGAEEAYPNSPFLPGDRVWTDGHGRAEFQFPDGAVLRLDSRGKLDYLTHDEARGEKIVLKLWSGGLYLRTRGERGGSAVEIETPAGLVETHDRGTYRIDVEAGETRLSVYEGEAVLDGGGRRVAVDAGQRAYVRRGEEPERPQSFDNREEDEFAAWDRERQGRETFVDGGRRYLPEELSAYSGELESNGAWRHEASVGYVWQPYVEAGWAPYTRGRWSWTSYGWTWIPGERWGWAPFHYGRWGQSASFGWYWIPGRSWGPAWVSWASGGDYVGWCPLGWRDRPVHGWGGSGGVAVHRGNGQSAWNFVRRGDLGARDLSRRRLDSRVADLQQVRVVDSPRARPSRDLREFGAAGSGGPRAVPRGARIGPTPGDTVPELRVDRQTLPLGGGPRPRYDQREGAATRRGLREGPQTDRQTGEERATDVRSPRARPAQTPDATSGAEIRRTEPRRDPQRLAPAERGADHEVLGRFFRPLNEPQARPRSDRDAEAPTTAPRSREEVYRPRRDEERSRPRSEARQGRERGDGGGDRGVRSAPREERTPPPRVETRRSDPPRVEPRRSEPSRPAPRTERTERAAPRPPKQERSNRR
jgi:FecR protein